MASTKNTNTSTQNNASNDASGFKTVAFGFDKNDVTLYIASLRKKMKAMEEEFQLKLAQALENPAVSDDAMKHQREVIRAEMEKQWNDKIAERNSIMKNQQQQITELERQLAESNETIKSLKTQLSAATSTGDSGSSESAAAGAKAAEAYMRFTAELRSISESAQRTLASIEELWGGEPNVSQAAERDMPAASAPPVSKPAPAPAPKASDKGVSIDKPLSKATEEKKPAPAISETGFGSLIFEDEVEDPLAGIVSDINGDGSEVKVPINGTYTPAPAPAPKPTPAPKPAPAPTPKPAPAPAKAEIPDEFASLLADGAADEPDAFADAPAVAKGDDLDTDLLSDIVIAPGEEHNGGDLGKMLKDKEQSEFDEFQDLFVTPIDGAGEGIDEDIADLTVTPVAEAELKPGISTEFDLSANDKTDMEGLENFLADTDESASESGAEAAPEPEQAGKNKEEDLFDFSFLAADDEEDDMSSDISAGGML